MNSALSNEDIVYQVARTLKFDPESLLRSENRSGACKQRSPPAHERHAHTRLPTHQHRMKRVNQACRSTLDEKFWEEITKETFGRQIEGSSVRAPRLPWRNFHTCTHTRTPPGPLSGGAVWQSAALCRAEAWHSAQQRLTAGNDCTSRPRHRRSSSLPILRALQASTSALQPAPMVRGKPSISSWRDVPSH